jgi:hypothetical protein
MGKAGVLRGEAGVLLGYLRGVSVPSGYLGCTRGTGWILRGTLGTLGGTLGVLYG